MAKEEEDIYLFLVALSGRGKTPDEAWKEAVEAFKQKPGEYEQYKKVEEGKNE